MGRRYIVRKDDGRIKQRSLEDQDVSLIRALVREREELKEKVRQLSDKKLGEKFGVSPTTISQVANFHCYKHVVE